MAKSARPLLVQGNAKLSPGVSHFDLPPVQTCPGRSPLCESRCYATRGRFRFPQVQSRLWWAYRQTLRADFVNRLVDELYRMGVLVCRFHVAGDIYSPGYGGKLVEVIRRSSHCLFWLYTRSWRIASIEPVLVTMSGLPNMTVYYSADSQTGFPQRIPPGVRVCWMQVEEGDAPASGIDLLFRDHALRRRVPLQLADRTCPTELPSGHATGISCATCGHCWRK